MAEQLQSLAAEAERTRADARAQGATGGVVEFELRLGVCEATFRPGVSAEDFETARKWLDAHSASLGLRSETVVFQDLFYDDDVRIRAHMAPQPTKGAADKTAAPATPAAPAATVARKQRLWDSEFRVLNSRYDARGSVSLETAAEAPAADRIACPRTRRHQRRRTYHTPDGCAIELSEVLESDRAVASHEIEIEVERAEGASPATQAARVAGWLVRLARLFPSAVCDATGTVLRFCCPADAPKLPAAAAKTPSAASSSAAPPAAKVADKSAGRPVPAPAAPSPSAPAGPSAAVAAPRFVQAPVSDVLMVACSRVIRRAYRRR